MDQVGRGWWLLAACVAGCGWTPSRPVPPQEPGKVAFTGQAQDAVTRVPVPEVQVCVRDHPEVSCMKADPAGMFQLLGLPASTPVIFEFKKRAYFDHLAMFTTTASSEDFSYGLLSDFQMDALAATAGVEMDGQKGQLLFGALDRRGKDDQPVEGVAVELSPSGGIGPLYQGPNGVDRNLTATSAKGRGGFMNLDPGDYELTYRAPGKTCEPYFS